LIVPKVIVDDDEWMVTEKGELATRSEQAPRLRDPLVGVGPDRCSVLGDGEVERLVRVGDGLGIAVDQVEVEAVL
jgi:hypothetical protein